MHFMGFDQRRLLTLAGTVVLAGAVIAAGVYGPSAWKVLRHQTESPDQVVIQTPPVGMSGTDQGNTGENTGRDAPATTTQTPGLNTVPKNDTTGVKKYKEPDNSLMDLAPSIKGYFAEDTLSDPAKNLAFGSGWNIHQYVDGYLFGPNAGPQMNEEDIKKYIVFHKTLWDKQIKNEAGFSKATAFNNYLDLMFNRGVDAFDSKDKARIEQFHQEIHDLDTHLFRNDSSSKIYGATPFATKR